MEDPADGWLRVSLAWPASRKTSYFNAPVSADCSGLGHINQSGSYCLLHSFKAPHKGYADLKKTGNLRAIQLLLRHTKMDSAVRYLGVELEDALAIAEALEI